MRTNFLYTLHYLKLLKFYVHALFFAIVIAGRYLHTHDVGGRITTAAGSKDKIVPWIMQRFIRLHKISDPRIILYGLVLHDITIYINILHTFAIIYIL